MFVQVFFERGIPHIYEGDLMKENDLLGWLVHQKRHSEIPEVTDEMMDKLIESTEYLAVIFCMCYTNVCMNRPGCTNIIFTTLQTTRTTNRTSEPSTNWRTLTMNSSARASLLCASTMPTRPRNTASTIYPLSSISRTKFRPFTRATS